MSEHEKFLIALFVPYILFILFIIVMLSISAP